VSDTVTPTTAGQHLLITVSLVVAVTLVSLDMTIVNVALPHMQASLNAGADEIIWVLTSYLVASAIAMPLVGWMASRFGRNRIFFTCVAGFTLASVLCGVASSLEMMVCARLAQGACGAGLVPLAQATLLDINPPSRHARAMAVFSLGTMVGPMLGPTIGGYITDTFTWRWVFLMNIPVGLGALAGLWFATRGMRQAMMASRFDWFGFLAVSLAIGAFQLILDRGHQLGWFDSAEIGIEAGIAALALWCAVVHTMTTPGGFIKPAVFANRNFVLGCLFSAAAGLVCFATAPMIVVMQQNLFGYTPMFTGELGMARSVAMVVGIVLVTRAVNRIGPRIPLAAALMLTALGMGMMAGLTLQADPAFMLVASIVQGMGQGMLFVPMSVIVYGSLAPELRNEGSVIYSLMRMIGASVGLSMIQVRLNETQADAHSRLAAHIRPDAPMVSWQLPDLDLWAPAQALRIQSDIVREASMQGYINVFSMITVATVLLVPLLLAMRPARKTTTLLATGE